MALSPNYSWAEPDNSSLVKNGAQDIRALGDAIDTSVWNIGYGQAGKNKIINGDMSIWQRGTSFSSIFAVYTADRYISGYGSGGTQSIARQDVTGATGLPSYIRWAMRYSTTSAASGQYNVTQRIEDVQTLAGQTVTFSFYARRVSGTGTTMRLNAYQLFGSGGSTFTQPATDIDFTVTNSDFQRFSYTFTMPSMAGKTIGTDSYLDFRLAFPTAVSVFDTTGWQLEAGAKATPFQTASGGSDQGELAMCQRYLPAFSGSGLGGNLFNVLGWAYSTTNAQFNIPLLVTPRVRPTGMTISALSDFSVANQGFSSAAPTAISFNSGGQIVQVNTTTTAGSPTLVTGQIANLSLSGANGILLFTGCEL
jgi:hypothetical protein